MTQANIRVHWADSGEGKYGETRAFVRIRYAERGVRYAGFARDGSGHSLPRGRRTLCFGKPSSISLVFTKPATHWGYRTADFADIMYFFGYDKGDVREYFGRYRRKLRERADIAKNSGISPQDRARFIQVLK